MRVTIFILNVGIDAILVLEYIALGFAIETMHRFYFYYVAKLVLESSVFRHLAQVFFVNRKIAKIVVLLFLEHLFAVDNAMHNSCISFLRMILCKEAYLGLII